MSRQKPPAESRPDLVPQLFGLASSSHPAANCNALDDAKCLLTPICFLCVVHMIPRQGSGQRHWHHTLTSTMAGDEDDLPEIPASSCRIRRLQLLLRGKVPAPPRYCGHSRRSTASNWIVLPRPLFTSCVIWPESSPHVDVVH
eukprot:CAMPEP_0181311058 /NCGR_PEP_ID=MMETSP1101-20121128/12928_1 /TAXON_ID=46948 /ORGANISM="Rhodomonas abbreviata, Strain Caron Lab Isolate" /LENGTH=142 /DNA_ID=CAMNT_0023417751 /DNA_START=146 /DNA_END=574 /DNA_ORIENTATION=+